MIKLVLPVYYTQTYKTKPNKTILVGMNWYRNAHHFAQNTIKQEFSSIIKNQLVNYSITFNKFEVEYVYYYKSKISDLSNVCSMASKIVLDSLQELNIVQNDNVQYCLRETFIVGLEDKSNPRIEVTIKPVS